MLESGKLHDMESLNIVKNIFSITDCLRSGDIWFSSICFQNTHSLYELNVQTSGGTNCRHDTNCWQIKHTAHKIIIVSHQQTVARVGLHLYPYCHYRWNCHKYSSIQASPKIYICLEALLMDWGLGHFGHPPPPLKKKKKKN